MRFLRQSMIGLFLTALTLGLLAYAAVLIGGAVQQRMSDTARMPPAKERVFSVNVVKAQAEDIVPVLETFGQVQSRRLLELRAAAAGRVIELADDFADGAEVRADQVLARLDPRDTQAAVDRAASDVADAEAEGRDAARGLVLARDELAAAQEQADLRQRAFERQRDLGDRGVGTAIATETAELAASAARQAALSRRQAEAQAQARVDQAATTLTRTRLALAEAERRLDDMTVTVPFDGALSDTSVVVGRLVSANEQMAVLIDPDDLEVSFRVSTAQYARLLDSDGSLIHSDIAATLDVAGVDLTATGQITRTSAAAGDGATGRLIFATLSSSAGFKPGDFVTVRVEEPLLRGVTRLPASALDAQGNVLVINDAERLEQVPVTLLRRQGDDVLVRGPLAGREVVEAQSPLLGAGIAVKPLRGENTAPVEPQMLELTQERRARLVAFVEANQRMPEAAKARVLAQLAEPMVPAQMVERIESRMGG